MTATQTAAKALHLLISEGRTPNEQNIPPYAQQAGKQTDRCPYPLFTLDFYTVPYVYAHPAVSVGLPIQGTFQHTNQACYIIKVIF